MQYDVFTYSLWNNFSFFYRSVDFFFSHLNSLRYENWRK